jgi:glycosyltransferase involved in cell wall biosynthesis
MIEKMVEHFSPTTVSEIFTPEYRAPGSKVMSELRGDRSILRELREFEPDLVYSDNALYAAQFQVNSQLSSLHIPHIAHLRGDWWREFWAWWPTAKWPAHLIGMQHFVYQSAALLTARQVTPICKWLEFIVRHYIPGKKTTVVYQGVDPTQFYPDDEPYPLEKPAVAIIQNHTILPKVEGLLNLYPVVAELSGVNFYITEGERFDPGYLEVVKKRYSGLTNVRFVPDINGPNAVRRLLTSADCYLLASELDCCPTTVLEASLMQRPVIASRIGGVPEIIQEGVTGWTVNNQDSTMWIERVRSVFKDPSFSRRIGANGRKWVEENFSWNKIAKQVEQLIKSEAN